MKKILIITLFSLIFVALTSLNPIKVNALVQINPQYDVEIEIAKDASFIVKETITYVFNGEFHGIRRDIKKADPEISQRCISNPGLTCGGFDRIVLLGVYDENMRQFNQNEYSFYDYEDEDTGNQYARVERELYPNGKNVTNERVTWTVIYKVYGGIQWIGENPYFYWNMLPEQRNGNTERSEFKIILPEESIFNKDKMVLYDYPNNGIVRINDNKLEVSLKNLGSTGNYTLAYKFDPEELVKPASLSYIVESPDVGITVYLDDLEVSDQSVDRIDSIPTGKHTLKVSHFGYYDYVEEFNLESGEDKSVTVNLEPTAIMSLLLILNWLCLFSCFFFVPAAILFVFLNYRRKGRDVDMPKTIIPLFKPPTDVRPYLLGSLKDEEVNKEDIAGSIIDLAYRGYLKIKEIEKDKDYLLTRTEPKVEEDKLNDNEEYLLDSIFGKATEKKVSDMKTTFPIKYMLLKQMIYKEMVARGYFDRSPETVRGSYFAIGFFLLFLGVILTILLSLFWTAIIGYISLFTPGLALFVMGFGFMLVAKFMPAKTKVGSKVYADILGFKMYLNTAERFRLQKLGPDEFEKYLSYAIVFGIEKEWAKKFEGIYDRVPDWYEGSGSVYDALWISSFSRSFANSAVSSMTPVQSSSGSGWSGSSGSFGGFSGGGGGGGSSGGW